MTNDEGGEPSTPRERGIRLDLRASGCLIPHAAPGERISDRHPAGPQQIAQIVAFLLSRQVP
jgi:hypothetical protein